MLVGHRRSSAGGKAFRVGCKNDQQCAEYDAARQRSMGDRQLTSIWCSKTAHRWQKRAAFNEAPQPAGHSRQVGCTRAGGLAALRPEVPERVIERWRFLPAAATFPCTHPITPVPHSTGHALPRSRAFKGTDSPPSQRYAYLKVAGVCAPTQTPAVNSKGHPYRKGLP